MKKVSKFCTVAALMAVVSGVSIAADDVVSTVIESVTPTGTTKIEVNKSVKADFKNKLLLIPCVEVTDSIEATGANFDGYYNVLMEISGSGFENWKVKETTVATGEECDDGTPDNSKTDDLLKSMGMPSIAQLISGVGKEDGSKDEPPSQQHTDINNAISSIVNGQINTAISGAK